MNILNEVLYSTAPARVILSEAELLRQAAKARQRDLGPASLRMTQRHPPIVVT